MNALRSRMVSEQRRIDVIRIEEEANRTPAIAIKNNALQASGSQRGSGRYRGGHSRGSGLPRDTVNRDNAKCTYCGKQGHYTSLSRLRISNQREKQPTQPKNDADQKR